MTPSHSPVPLSQPHAPPFFFPLPFSRPAKQQAEERKTAIHDPPPSPLRHFDAWLQFQGRQLCCRDDIYIKNSYLKTIHQAPLSITILKCDELCFPEGDTTLNNNTNDRYLQHTVAIAHHSPPYSCCISKLDHNSTTTLVYLSEIFDGRLRDDKVTQTPKLSLKWLVWASSRIH